MPTTTRSLKARQEERCTAITAERKYYEVDKTFIKRSLRPDEWIYTHKGTVHVPRLGIERILNEGAALRYIKKHTNIPIPELYACFEDDQSAFLVTSYVEGVSMKSPAGDQKAVIMQELEEHIETMHSLRSSRLGGPEGHFILPYRVMIKTPRDEWNMQQAATDEYVFCHNDLTQYDIIVNPDTLRIAAIIDWEYEGFFPADFEFRFYKRSARGSVARDGEEDDSDTLLKFVMDQ